MDTTKEEQEAKEAWRKHSIEKAQYEYQKAILQSEEDANYVQAVSANSRTYAIYDFQTATIEALEKEIDEHKATDNYILGLTIAISLVKTIKPKTE